MKTKKSNLLIYIIIGLILISLLIIGFITNWHFFMSKEPLKLSDKENLFKKMMDEDYKNIFPNNTNRNAAGFRFFQYIYDNLATSNELFDIYNQFYCAVSGAIVSPGQDNFSILKVKDLNGNCVFGKYYRCCTPCDCDIMKYTRIIKAEISIPKGSNNKYFKNFITIGDPCVKDSEIPEEMDKKILKCQNNLSENGYRINEQGEITKGNGRLIIGILYPITSEETKNIENSVQGCITGNKRFLSSPENLKYGMGDIFVKLALLNDKEKYTHTENDFCKISETFQTNKKNIYGLPLEICENRDQNYSNGSMMSDGTCSEEGGGVHQICVESIGTGNSFSKSTGQSDWSSSRGDKNHCACLGAWANYVTQHSDKTLKCSAIPETVFDKKYVENWKNWNDVTLNDQITNGINGMYSQCVNQAPNEDAKIYLQNKYIQMKDQLSKSLI